MKFDIEECMQLMADLYHFDNSAFPEFRSISFSSETDELNEEDLELLSAASAQLSEKKWIGEKKPEFPSR